MMKKARRVGVEGSPSSSAYPVGEEAKARLKYQGLMQDYEELLKETEAKRKKLEKAKLRKHRLLAEVKFLRRKYNSFTKKPYEESLYRLKKQSPMIPSLPPRILQAQAPVVHSEGPLKDRRLRLREAGMSSTPAVLDLNQASVPSGEEMEEFQVEWEPLKMENLTRYSVDGEVAANDLKLSICRDAGNGPNRVGKRKISWQDPVALRV